MADVLGREPFMLLLLSSSIIFYGGSCLHPALVVLAQSVIVYIYHRLCQESSAGVCVFGTALVYPLRVLELMLNRYLISSTPFH